MPRKLSDTRTTTPTDGSSRWWSATDRSIAALLGGVCLALSSCFSPRSNPLDPLNPNAATTFTIALCCESTGGLEECLEDTLPQDTFSLRVSSPRSGITLTIWRFDTTGDGSIDLVDTVFATSRLYITPRTRDREIGIAVTAIREDGARGSDSATILPVWRVFSEETGMPQNDVTALAVDSLGDLWAGFEGGFLLHHDGAKWVRQDDPPSPALADLGEVSRILVDAGNDKWIGINESGTGSIGGLMVFDADGGWRDAKIRTFDAIRFILGLAMDGRERLWILTRDHGVYASPLHDTGEPIHRPALDSLFFSEEYLRTEGYRSKPLVIASVATTPDGGVWLGSKNHGLICDHGTGRWINYTSLAVDTARNRVRSELPADQITALAGAPDGSVWVGTLGGLVHYRPDRQQWEVTRVGQAFLAERDKVRTIAVARSGEVWVGMVQGLVRIAPDGSWEKFTTDNSPLPHNSVGDIVIAPTGTVWIATDGGVVRYHRY
jgi:ligand-binding sensor domain-containing protein